MTIFQQSDQLVNEEGSSSNADIVDATIDIFSENNSETVERQRTFGIGIVYWHRSTFYDRLCICSYPCE